MKTFKFGSHDPLAKLSPHPQADYLRCYLSDLHAGWVIEETRYFDRDYLQEHSAYYGSLAAQPPNVCRRLHFFDKEFKSEVLDRALEGSAQAQSELQSSYLGFSVIRPLGHAPFGRTVVSWYPDQREKYGGNPRIDAPSRKYVAHLAGVPLTVRGLAWQQQDGAVALCATTALWTMLHSSAFDDHHAIPTTTDVTRFAYRSLREGAHVFPAMDGLDNRQILEAIARAHLTPVLVDGDAIEGFSSEFFSTTVATLLRSGYPVLLSGTLEDRGGHLTCVTGFRASGTGRPNQDATVRIFYVHDDNLGSNVRQVVESDELQRVVLRPEAPEKRYAGEPLHDPAKDYPAFRPQQLIVGVHDGLHMPPSHLNRIGDQIVKTVQSLVEDGAQLTATVRFAKLSTYSSEIISDALKREPKGLRLVRQKLADDLQPIGLHLGVVRIGTSANELVADVLIDASDLGHFEHHDSSAWWRAFGTVIYAKPYEPILRSMADALSLGVVISDGAK